MMWQWVGVVGLLLAGAVACGEDEGQRALSAATDAGASSCQCLDLSAIVAANNLDLCDCPVIEYGCESAPQTFQRVCDVAPPCWSTVIDPATGCAMPAVSTELSEACSCGF